MFGTCRMTAKLRMRHYVEVSPLLHWWHFLSDHGQRDKWYLLTAKFFRRLPNERITDGKVPRTCADGREKETIHLVWQMHSRPRFHLGLILAVPI